MNDFPHVDRRSRPINPKYEEADRLYPIGKCNGFFSVGLGPTQPLADAAGVSLISINNWCRAGYVPKGHFARALEFATGISRLKWLYPEEYGNAFIEWKLMGYPLRSREGVEFLLQTRAGKMIKGR